MNQGIQDTIKDPVLKDSGCYFLCLLKMAELVRKREITEDQIIYLFTLAKRLEYVQKDATVLFPHDVVNLAIQEPLYTKTTIRYEKPLEEYFITYLTKPGYGHFNLQKGNGVWDPLNPQRLAAKDYKVTSYRAIT